MLAKAGQVTQREHERVEQARVAARVAVALRPLERVAARGGARVVEVDEDVVERRRPLAARLAQHVPVEGPRRRQTSKQPQKRDRARGRRLAPGAPCSTRSARTAARAASRVPRCTFEGSNAPRPGVATMCVVVDGALGASSVVNRERASPIRDAEVLASDAVFSDVASSVGTCPSAPSADARLVHRENGHPLFRTMSCVFAAPGARLHRPAGALAESPTKGAPLRQR